MFMYAVKKPAAAAAAALGEDGAAVFCEGPGLLFASARGETPDAGITTAIFNDVEKGDIHAGCDPSVDNMLKITGDGRKVALDPKLLYLEDDPDM